MRYLEGSELKWAREFLDEAKKTALESTCQKSKRGIVIVRYGGVIGRGSNNPPFGFSCNVECRDICREYAVHAEMNAVLDALNNGFDVRGSRMYHVKIKNGKEEPSEKPSCTRCSAFCLEAGIGEFVLPQREGVALYDMAEFHNISLLSVKGNV